MTNLIERVKNNPNSFYRFAKIHKKQGYIFMSENYFKVNLLDKKGTGIRVTVFKGINAPLSVTIAKVKKFTEI